MEHDLENAERMDVMSVNDDPHDWYAPHKHHPDDKIPQTYEGKRGQVLLKSIEYSTIECPACGTDARQDERGLPVCPACGVVCTSPKRSDHKVIHDPKTAERVDDNGNFIQ